MCNHMHRLIRKKKKINRINGIQKNLEANSLYLNLLANKSKIKSIIFKVLSWKKTHNFNFLT